MQKIVFLFLTLPLLFISCNKEQSYDEKSQDSLQSLLLGDETEDKDAKEKEYQTCLEFIFPITLTMPDGLVISGEKDELWNSVKSWYEMNPESKDKPNLNFPIELRFLKEDIVKTITSKEEFLASKKYCSKNTVLKNCFELVYPIIWIMPDETSITMNHKEDWITIKDWYMNNPDSEEKPVLEFPVDILLYDGTAMNIQNEAEMIQAKKDCE